MYRKNENFTSYLLSQFGSTQQICKALNVKPTNIYNWVFDDKIPHKPATRLYELGKQRNMRLALSECLHHYVHFDPLYDANELECGIYYDAWLREIGALPANDGSLDNPEEGIYYDA